MASKEMVKSGEVAGFLSVHMLHHGTEMWVGLHDERGLGGVDEGCGEFAGLVDAELERLNSWVELKAAWGGRGGLTALSRNLCCSFESGTRRLAL